MNPHRLICSRNCLAFLLIAAISIALMFGGDQDESALAEEKVPAPGVADTSQNPHRTLGLFRGDCKKCHPSETASWMQTVHFQSAELRLYRYTGNTRKYADELGIKPEDLLGDSICADCHATKTVKHDSTIDVISGVSCESCHGPSGGEEGWLNPHQSYHESRVIPRTQETPEHRQKRIMRCESAGMIRSENIAGMARRCYSCHIIKNEKLIAAGHKPASAAMEFVAWTDGEIRHNFFMNRAHNAASPSLWMETNKNSDAQAQRRVKFVVGALVQLEMSLRARATAKSPVVIPQFGGLAAAANGRLAQVMAVAPSPEIAAVSGIFTPVLGTIFAPLPTDEKTYTELADKIAEQTEQFLLKHDGTNLKGLDSLLQTSQPYFSQQYKDKYQTQSKP